MSAFFSPNVLAGTAFIRVSHIGENPEPDPDAPAMIFTNPENSQLLVPIL